MPARKKTQKPKRLTEDEALSILADERERTGGKYLSHAEVWGKYKL